MRLRQITLSLLSAVAVLAAPAFAQDDNGGFDLNDFFNSPPPADGESAVTPNAARPDILADLRSWLEKAKAGK